MELNKEEFIKLKNIYEDKNRHIYGISNARNVWIISTIGSYFLFKHYNISFRNSFFIVPLIVSFPMSFLCKEIFKT